MLNFLRTHGSPIVVVLLCVAATAPLSAQQLKGTWQGAITTDRNEVVFTAVFDGTGKGTLEVLGKRLEIASVAANGGSVEFRLGGNDPAVFRGKQEGETVSGTYRSANENLPFSMEREPDLAPPANRVEAWRQDLEYARWKLLKLDKSFILQTRAAYNSALTQLISDAPNLRDDQIIVGLARAVALADNGHTRLYLLRNKTDLRRYPIRVWWFRDGPYVVRAPADKSAILGCRVLSVSGTPAARLRDLFAPLYAGSATWDEYMASYLITSPEILAGLGVLKEPGASEWKLRCANDTSVAKLEPLPLERKTSPVEAWWDLSPGESMGSPGMKGVSLRHVPLYLRHTEKNYWFERVAKGVLYFQFNRATDDPADPMSGFADRLIASVEKERPKALVVDLRFNTGGDLGVGRPLMERLHEAVGNADVYVISGRATFSAGLYHAAQWKEWKGTTVVGEPVGDRLEFWSEGGNIKLPNSALTIHFANGFHTYSARPHPAIKAFAELAAGSVDPSPEISVSFAEYKAGTDPVMNAILLRLHR